MRNKIAYKLHIQGRVQGVGFRYFTYQQAIKLGIQGWVQNEPDGSVKALVLGEETSLRQLLGLLNEGPPAAVVTALDKQEITPPKIEGEFRMIR